MALEMQEKEYALTDLSSKYHDLKQEYENIDEENSKKIADLNMQITISMHKSIMLENQLKDMQDQSQ